MDMTCAHLPYIITAYAFSLSILGLLIYWILRADQKIRQRLARWRSDVS